MLFFLGIKSYFPQCVCTVLHPTNRTWDPNVIHRVLTSPSVFLFKNNEFSENIIQCILILTSHALPSESSQIFPSVSFWRWPSGQCEWNPVVVLLCFLMVKDTASLLLCLLCIWVSGWGCVYTDICAFLHIHLWCMSTFTCLYKGQWRLKVDNQNLH